MDTSTSVTVRVMGLSSTDTNPEGKVWWDGLLIVEGTYNGPYFDGSTPAAEGHGPASWTGAPHASTSKLWGMPTP